MMRPLPHAGWLLFLCVCALELNAMGGQFLVVSNEVPVRLFGGASQEVPVTVRNEDASGHEAEIRYRLFQVSSSTAARVRDGVWKKLNLPPGLTVLDSAKVDLPAVRAETRFVLQWIEGESKVIGKTVLRVFPSNLLEALTTMAKGGGLGLQDPDAILSGALKAQGVEAAAVSADSLEQFDGKVAVVVSGPAAEESAVLSKSLKMLAGKGIGVVWIQPPAPGGFIPSFQSMRTGDGVLVRARLDMVAHFDRDPESQSNLVRLIGLALNEPGSNLSKTDDP